MNLLTLDQLKVLLEYAAHYGIAWKECLTDEWADGTDDKCHNGHLLRQIRNQFGPEWLQAFGTGSAADAPYISMLHDRGYRRTSHAHRIITRIDRPDWIQFLAKKQCCAPIVFYERDGTVDGGSADYYRRTYSKDQIIVLKEWIKQFTGSGHDPTGYIPEQGEIDLFKAAEDKARLLLRVSNEDRMMIMNHPAIERVSENGFWVEARVYVEIR